MIDPVSQVLVPRPTIPAMLRAAADEVERRGLHKHYFMPPAAERETCPVCLWGALNYINTHDPRNSNWPGMTTVARLLAEIIREDWPTTIGANKLASDPAGTSTYFNDSDGITAADVAGVLRRAADRYEVRHPAEVSA